MDQKQTGKFIAEMRRERGLTQKELADRLLISDKTVSKWECGGGFPEVGLMLPLCNELGVTVNELLSGKRLHPSEYQKNAEANIVRLMKEKSEYKLKIALAIVVLFITLLSSVSLCAVIEYVDLTFAWKVTLLVIAISIMLLGVAVCVALDRMATEYECAKCGERFVPKVDAYMRGMHTIKKRYLKCPKCGERNWCILHVKDSKEKTENEQEKTQE